MLFRSETKPERRVSQQAIFAARKEILGLYMADAVEEYLVQLGMATRTPGNFPYPEHPHGAGSGRSSPRGGVHGLCASCPDHQLPR